MALQSISSKFKNLGPLFQSPEARYNTDDAIKGDAMSSPFPGMDPYLEAPDIWPDFRDAFAGEIRAELNQTLPAPYYARLEMRPEVGIVEDGGYQRRIVPDVAVVRPPRFPVDQGGI